MARSDTDTSCGVEKTFSELREKRAQARQRREAAEKALRKRLEEIKVNKEFQEVATQEAERATAKFAKAYATASEPEPSKTAATGSPVTACKRMLGSLSKTITKRKLSFVKTSSMSPREQDSKAEPAAGDDAPQITEAAEINLDGLVTKLSGVLRGGIRETFERLAGSSAATLSPVNFQVFLSEVDPGIKKHQAGGLWRRGDANCDGQMDFAEFNALFNGNNFSKERSSKCPG